MKRMTFVLPALLVAVFLFATTASAVVYDTGYVYQTVPGETFNLGGGVALSDGTDGYFTIEARGDYFNKGPTATRTSILISTASSPFIMSGLARVTPRYSNGTRSSTITGGLIPGRSRVTICSPSHRIWPGP
jgi:hypothetical protein